MRSIKVYVEGENGQTLRKLTTQLTNVTTNLHVT